MAKAQQTSPPGPVSDPASPSPAPDMSPPTRGGVYQRLPGGDLRRVEPTPPTVPTDSVEEENRA